MAVKDRTPSTFDVSLEIGVPPVIVFDAFFEERALAVWLGTSRAIAVPRLLGPYVLEWPATDERDDVFGRGGGVLRGSVLQIGVGEHVFLADVYWLPPDSGPLGPFAVQVTFTESAQPGGASSTLVRVVISGFDEGVRWKRYHEIVVAQWQRALRVLKTLLEKESC